MICMYSIVKCPNFGCDESMDRAHYEEHRNSCQFKVNKCDKCETLIDENQPDHDCVKALKARFEQVERQLISISKKVEYNHC